MDFGKDTSPERRIGDVMITESVSRLVWYLCFRCELRYGDEDELETPSRLCPNCRKYAWDYGEEG